MGVRVTALLLRALLLAAFLAIPGADPVNAQDAGGEGASIEVRVAARRLADGRTEFAAQQRLPDGAWDERQLPRARFFPAGTRVGRWLASSPLTVAAPDGRGEAEVRVAAQLLADGRMEFALQERGADGAWGERRLPRARFFPADARVGRWLASSPLTVAVPPSGPAGSEEAALPAPGSVALDRAALVALYEVTDGPNWFNSANWLTSSPIGEWHGVTTDRDGRVVGLDLLRNRLTGSIPEELASLARLESLNLGGNDLSGPFPVWLGNLTRLEALTLDSNLLTGPIRRAAILEESSDFVSAAALRRRMPQRRSGSRQPLARTISC